MVTFPDGVFPITTNVQGAVNNVVQSSTTVASLIFNNILPHYDTTLIPAGSTLTVNGGLTVSDNANITSAAITGGGSLTAGANGTSTILVETTGNGALLLDLSGLTNFVFNAGASSPGNLDMANQLAPAGGTQIMNLAAASNNITVGTMNLGNNNTRGSVTFNLGNGTNILNTDTLTLGESKTSGTMQFINNAGGGLKIASHTGTGRTTINMGTEGSSGSTSTSAVGDMLFNGGTVNILAGTVTMANRVGRAGANSTAVISFNSGIMDATTINMALNVSPTTSGTDPAFATLSVGSTGVLKIGSGGLSMVNEGGTAGAGTLIITNGGTVICSNNIYKTTGNGVATIAIGTGTLSMAGTIGVSNGLAIDNFDVTNANLTLSLANVPAITVNNFNPDVTNTINISALPTISSIPAQFQVITFSTPGGNLNTFAMGTLPAGFSGYISNNTTANSIDLVLTSGPVAKSDEWGGGVNNQWDTSSLNWTNSGVAVTYNDLDFVTFDDLSKATNVNITSSRAPASWTMNNNNNDFFFTGSGKITGPVQLVVNGSATNVLAETGGDNFSGGIQANAGTIILDDTNGAISGGVNINGGATVQIGNNDASGNLPGGAISDGGVLIFDRTNAFSTGTAISGGGNLVQNGTGTLTLTASQTYSGNTLVNAGTLTLSGSGAIASSPQVNVNNATLSTSGVTANSSVATIQNLNLTNADLNVEITYVQTNLNITGTLSMGGIANTDNIISLPAIASYPATNAILYSANPITGYNMVLGTLPSATPAYAGSLLLSANQTTLYLVLTSGPIGTRPSVTWSGADAINTGNTNWSDAQNWVTPGVPAAAEKVTFNDTDDAGGTPFNSVGDGIQGIVSANNIENVANISLTNAGLIYANTGWHNTEIVSGNTLTENGSVLVDGSGGNVSVLGSGSTMQINNPGGTTFAVAASSAPTLDMSGLDTFNASVSQIGVGYNPASAGSVVKGIWYLAKTNYITTGPGNFSTSAALVVGGAGGTGTVYLGQSNVLNLDGIVLGISTSSGDSITFNPALTSPVAYIRGITGSSSRVTTWSLGDDSMNVNNSVGGSGQICDFTAGTLNALVGTLIVGQGAQGNTLAPNPVGTFNMGAGLLDVTTLDIGLGDNGKTGGNGAGTMNVTGGTVLVNSLSFAVNGPASTTGTLDLSSGATLVVSNGVTIGAGTASATLGISSSTVKILSGTLGTSASGLANLNLDGGSLTINANGSLGAASIIATNVTTGATTTINLGAIANVSSTEQIPLLSYQGTDPFSGLQLGTYPPGYAVTLVDNTGNSSVDISIVPPVVPTPRITGISVSGITLNLTATNGANGGQYTLLGTTNITLPLNQWTAIFSNNFDGSGHLNISTNVINPAVPHEFYILVQP